MPHDPAHLGDSACRVRDKLQHEHREGAVEGVVLKRQGLGVRLPEVGLRVGIARTREFQIRLGQIDTGDFRDIGDFGQGERQATGPATDIENAVTVRKTTKSDQERREAAAPSAHE